MIAIFGNKKDADDYSELIHSHLTENRPEYNAIRWSDENKSDAEDEWAVKLPPDLDDLTKLKKKIEANHLEKSIRQIDKYPDDWKNEEPIN